MIPVATAEQARARDAVAMDALGLPGIALMEVASLRVAEVVRARLPHPQVRVVVLTGGGNNGGDGWAVARWLHSWGVSVAVWSLKAPSAGDAAVMFGVAKRLGLPVTEDLGDAELVVDAVFGTGLRRDVQGDYAAALQRVAASGLPVVAVDLPSGLCSDTGRALGTALPATVTVCLDTYKRGLFLADGPRLTGEVLLADLGLGSLDSSALAATFTPSDVAARWPRRDPQGHKTRHGHLLVVAGSERLPGAAVLCCRGALASGVGLITLAVPRAALAGLSGLPPEVMLWPYDAPEELATEGLERFSAVAAGPGLSPLPVPLANVLRGWWRKAALPSVFDAGALGALGGRGAGPRVITPHPGEASRLLGVSVAELQSDRFDAVRRLAADGVTALLKGPHTLVATEGERTLVNRTGNAILSSGGSGDVLTGVVGALLARGVDAHHAAGLGAYVHGAAADLLRERREQGWLPSDVAAAVPDAVEQAISGG